MLLCLFLFLFFYTMLLCLLTFMFYYWWVWFNQEDTEGPHELSWTEPTHVPKCLELRIRRISILQFRSLEHEVELIKYILKNAKVLERMDILTGLSDLEESHQIFKIISELPRGSSACKPFLLNSIFSLSLQCYIVHSLSWLTMLKKTYLKL